MKLERVGAENLKLAPYRELLVSSYSKYLFEEFNTEFLHVYTVLDPDPIALLVAEFIPELQRVYLQSIKTDRKEAAHLLLDALEQDIQNQKMDSLTFSYEEEEITPNLVLLLDERGFSPPYPTFTRYFVDQHFFHPDWFDNPPPLLPNYTIEPFKITEEEKSLIKQKVRQGLVTEDINPLEDYPIETLNSVALRYKGTLIGWMVNKRVNENLILYSSLYVDENHRSTGVSITLLAHSIRLQQNSPLRYSLFEINNQGLTSWLKFVKKRLKNTAFDIKNSYYRFKMYKRV